MTEHVAQYRGFDLNPQKKEGKGRRGKILTIVMQVLYMEIYKT